MMSSQLKPGTSVQPHPPHRQRPTLLLPTYRIQCLMVSMLRCTGMYLDLDNECFVPSETIFHNYDVVLQGSGWEGVNNGMMASKPGHPMWMR